ncbi:MAG: aminotransferase class III-fold pyridoxal phosphate-dependent enzyme, partial [Actinobacteria bacterium]|nr:aminotransferase class III-fold pyridoxal phosphate-dependent enzyme [Actinomycetota bacterium]
DKFDSNFALFRLRNAIGLEANPNSKPIRDYLLSIKPANLLEKSFSDLKRVYINWSFDNPEIPRSTQAIEDLMAKTGAEVTIGYYCENRNVYQGEAFNPAAASARTFHLGVDVGMPAGTPIYAPLDGVIEIFNNNSTHLDYGPVVILRHKTDKGVPFWTLYGHLSIDSMPDWKIGKEIKAGGLIGRMGKEEENVGWPPHTHFQLLTDLCGMGMGAPSHVAVAELPDLFRGKYTGKGATEKYLNNLKKSISSLKQPISAFFAESIVSTAGQIVLPAGYLSAAYKMVRAAGGLCVSDEVQIGMGRVGEKFWGFELHDVVPDIVTLGKPLGNGHPLAAVVTTSEVAASFNNGMEYFNTFGGNPVSAAIGQAVLEVVYDQRLQL